MRVAYVSPFLNTENKYIDLQKVLLTELGFKLEPFSLSTIFSNQAKGFFDRRNVIMVHWLETRIFKVHEGNARLSLVGALQFIIYMITLAISRARLVYVVHDHAVHDTIGFKRALSIWAIRCLRKLADVRIVHDPSFSKTYDATYVPHPLYWEFGPSLAAEAELKSPLIATTAATLRQQPECGILGALRPYKGIHHLLTHWPQSIPLLICGKSVGSYADRLSNIIHERGLHNSVELRVGFLSDNEFATTLVKLDVIVLPHMSDTMLVSGAFFEAIGRVPIILARASPFIRWVETQHLGIIGFESDEHLEAALELVRHRWLSMRGHDPQAFALKAFGRSVILQAYRGIFA